MKIYDKVSWHIDAGTDKGTVLERFSIIFDFFFNNNLFNDDGIEIYELGIGSETSLHDGMLSQEGIAFANNYYNNILETPLSELSIKLSQMHFNEQLK